MLSDFRYFRFIIEQNKQNNEIFDNFWANIRYFDTKLAFYSKTLRNI